MGEDEDRVQHATGTSNFHDWRRLSTVAGSQCMHRKCNRIGVLRESPKLPIDPPVDYQVMQSFVLQHYSLSSLTTSLASFLFYGHNVSKSRLPCRGAFLRVKHELLQRPVWSLMRSRHRVLRCIKLRVAVVRPSLMSHEILGLNSGRTSRPSILRHRPHLQKSFLTTAL